VIVVDAGRDQGEGADAEVGAAAKALPLLTGDIIVQFDMIEERRTKEQVHGTAVPGRVAEHTAAAQRDLGVGGADRATLAATVASQVVMNSAIVEHYTGTRAAPRSSDEEGSSGSRIHRVCPVGVQGTIHQRDVGIHHGDTGARICTAACYDEAS